MQKETEKKPKNNSDESSFLSQNGKKEESGKAKNSVLDKGTPNAADKAKKVTLSEEEYTKLCEEAQKGIVYYDKFLRIHAELENIQKRTQKEKANFFQLATENVITKILPVVDNFDRAVDNVETTKPEDIKNFLNGVELIRKELQRVLMELGTEKLETVGKKFDPHFHEAVIVESINDESKDDVILAEIQAGYKMDGKLIRPAKVKVGRYIKK